VTVLRVENLWRFYGRTPAVKGIDLEVAAGSAYGFIGPNGAGKTTTLRVLATIDRPDAGRVWVAGRDTQHHRDAVRRELGFMADPPALYEELEVRDYLRYFAELYRVPPRQRTKRVARAVELTRIKERITDKCGGLSKGWRQRVQLAKTLVHDPAVLLLDEPASGLDPAARIEFREIVRALRDLGKTIVVSSHILTELADFCDSVGIIEHGRMLVSGQIGEILERLDPRDQLEVEVVGPGDAAAALLRGRPGVVEVTSDPRPDGTTVVRAAVEGRIDPARRAAALRALVEAGVEVAGLGSRRETLEDLFLKVAGKLQPGAGPLMSADALREILGQAPPQGQKAAAPAAREGA